MKTKTCLILLTAFSALVFNRVVSANPPAPEGVPALIPYQGILEKDGSLVNAIGAEQIEFRVALFDAAVDGNKIWPEAGISPDYPDSVAWDCHQVNVYDGRFAFNIGADKAYAQSFDSDLFLEIWVKGPSDNDFVKMGGRQQFLSTPNAVSAFQAVTAMRSDADFDVAGNLFANSIQTSGNPMLAIQDNNIDAADGLSLQADSGALTSLGGGLNVSGDVVAPNLWTKVYEGDVPHGQYFSIPNLDGTVHKVYKVYFQGTLEANAVDQIIVAAPNNVTTSNYVSFLTYTGTSTGATTWLNSFVLAKSCCGYMSIFNIEFTLTAVDYSNVGIYNCTVDSIVFSTNGAIHRYSGGGSFNGGPDLQISSLTLASGEYMQGRVQVFALNR
jgi:hypothetical protein